MRSTEIQYKLHADPELQAKEWDRQPRESAKAFQGFSLYRNLAEKRTYQQVAGAVTLQRLQYPPLGHEVELV